MSESATEPLSVCERERWREKRREKEPEREGSEAGPNPERGSLWDQHGPDLALLWHTSGRVSCHLGNAGEVGILKMEVEWEKPQFSPGLGALHTLSKCVIVMVALIEKDSKLRKGTEVQRYKNLRFQSKEMHASMLIQTDEADVYFALHRK